MKKLFILGCLSFFLQFCSYSQPAKKNAMDSTEKNNPVYSNSDTTPVNLKEEEWKKILPANVYQVARQKGTERPWSSPLDNIKDKGALREVRRTPRACI